MLEKILVFLSGKKTIISGLITTTSAYLVQMGQLTPETGAYIAAITLLLFGSAVMTENKIMTGSVFKGGF